MKKTRAKRVLRDGDTIKRDVEAPEPEPELAQGAPGAPQDDGATGFPCIYCRGDTEVTHSYRPFNTVQEPIQTVKKRARRCKECGRRFTTQESLPAAKE